MLTPRLKAEPWGISGWNASDSLQREMPASGPEIAISPLMRVRVTSVHPPYVAAVDRPGAFWRALPVVVGLDVSVGIALVVALVLWTDLRAQPC